MDVSRDSVISSESCLSPFIIYYSLCCCCCSVTQSCLTLCDPLDCSTSGTPVLHYLPESVQTPVHWVSDAIQPSHPLLLPSPPAFNLSQHQGLFQWVGSSHQVAKVFVLQLQQKSFEWVFRVDFCYDWLVWSLCSPAPQFKSINSLLINWSKAINSAYTFLTT